MALSEPYAIHRGVYERETGSVGWHAPTSEDVLTRQSGDRQGLSADEGARRMAEHGPNRLSQQQGPSAWAVLAREFGSPLIYALLIAVRQPHVGGESPVLESVLRCRPGGEHREIVGDVPPGGTRTESVSWLDLPRNPGVIRVRYSHRSSTLLHLVTGASMTVDDNCRAGQPRSHSVKHGA